MGTREIVEMALKLTAAQRFEIVERLRDSLDRPDPESTVPEPTGRQ